MICNPTGLKIQSNSDRGVDSMGRQTKSNSKVLDLVLGEDSFPPVIPQIMLITKFLVYNCVARELFVSNSSIQCNAEIGNVLFDFR